MWFVACCRAAGDATAQRKSPLLVVATCRDPNRVDPALRRPGRLDWERKVDLPQAGSPRQGTAGYLLGAKILVRFLLLRLPSLFHIVWENSAIRSAWPTLALLRSSATRNIRILPPLQF